MKKVVIGCLALFLIMVIAVTGVVIYSAVKINSVFTSIGEAGETLVQVDQKYPFTEPEDLTLDADRFKDYLALRSSIVDHLKSYEIVKEITKAIADPNYQPNVGFFDIIGMVGKIDDILKYVAGELDTKKMSFTEYSYYVDGTISSIYHASQDGHQEMTALWDDLSKASKQANASFQQSNQQQNVDIDVEQHMEDLSALSVPLQNVQIILDNKDELIKTKDMLIVELVMSEFINQIRAQQNAIQINVQQGAQPVTSSDSAVDPEMDVVPAQ